METGRPKRAAQKVVRLIDQVEEVMRIQTDMAASFVALLLERNLDHFLSVINRAAGLEGDKAIRAVVEKGPENNVLVYSNEEGECPWTFYDPTGAEHNPYALGMQEPETEQCAISHALRAALCYHRGSPVTETDPEAAYAALPKFWGQLIPGNLAGVNVDSLLEEVFEYNMEAEDNKDFARISIEDFPTSPREILGLLNTEYARMYAPMWD
jgi:hypothetical protein